MFVGKVDLERRASRISTLMTVCEGMETSKSLFMATYLSDKMMEMVCTRVARPEAIR